MSSKTQLLDFVACAADGSNDETPEKQSQRLYYIWKLLEEVRERHEDFPHVIQAQEHICLARVIARYEKEIQQLKHELKKERSNHANTNRHLERAVEKLDNFLDKNPEHRLRADDPPTRKYCGNCGAGDPNPDCSCGGVL